MCSEVVKVPFQAIHPLGGKPGSSAQLKEDIGSTQDLFEIENSEATAALMGMNQQGEERKGNFHNQNY